MPSIQKERFLSLDVFRGMTICLMIIVNTAGSGATPFAPLIHAHWYGFTLTDLVFPSFMFAVGNAMSFAQQKFGPQDNAKALIKIFKRTLIIFLCGYLLYWFPFFNYTAGHISLLPIDHTRIMGVLQRIALGYCFASLIMRYCTTRTAVILSGLFLFGYWALLYIFGDPADPLGMTTNAGIRLDKYILGDNHMYHGEGIAFDPEGILSTIPAIVNVIAGYIAGKFIQQKGKNLESITRFFIVGNLLIIAALLWNQGFPISKKLWTSSYVILTIGIDLVVLALLVYAIEIRSFKKGTEFFTAFGKNPLFIYLFAELMAEIFDMIPVGDNHHFYGWINQHFFQVIATGSVGSLLFAICFMLMCWLLAWILDKRKIYIRV
jgi:predicted acyltransferase